MSFKNYFINLHLASLEADFGFNSLLGFLWSKGIFLPQNFVFIQDHLSHQKKKGLRFFSKIPNVFCLYIFVFYKTYFVFLLKWIYSRATCVLYMKQGARQKKWLQARHISFENLLSKKLSPFILIKHCQSHHPLRHYVAYNSHR